MSWRGGEIQLFYLALGLARQHYPNFLIVQPEGALAKNLEKAHEPCLQDTLKILPVRMKGELDARAVWEIARILHRRQIHILHMHTAHAVTLGSLAGQIARVPLRIASRRVHFPLRSGFLSRCKYRWGIDKIIAVSGEVRNQLLRAGIAEDKIAVVPSGIDLSRFNPGVPANRLRRELKLFQDTPLVGVVGHLSPRKGHTLWIRAVPEILKEVPGAHFVLVGEGPQRQDLQEQVDALGLSKNVHLLGFRPDIPEILADLDVLLSTSFSEGSPASLKEAMALAKPVIALDGGGVRELITDGVDGILLPYPESLFLRENRFLRFGRESAGGALLPGLVTAVVSLLKDKEKRHRLGQAAIKKAQAYGMEAMIERTKAVYLELLRRKK